MPNPKEVHINTAMVFAAGFGKRLLPLTDKTPKPLILVNKKPLIRHNLERLEESGIQQIVINTHYLAEQVSNYIERSPLSIPDVSILYEPEILETGGGIVNALELLGSEPFYTINSDVILIDKEKHTPALQRLAANWNPVVMDALLLLHPTERAIGYDGHGDFNITSEGQIAYYGTESTAPYVFSGVMIVKPELFSSQEVHPFSIFRDFLFKRNLQKDHTLSRVYGLVHHGDWLHVGCAKGLEQAEYYFSRQSKQLNG